MTEFEIHRLNEHHLPQIIALHHQVVGSLPAGQVASETDAFFAAHIARCGQIHGLIENGRLVAYGVLGLPQEGDANFGADHGLAGADQALVAHIDGVAVAPDRRGRGLHRALIHHRLAVAAASGRRIFLSTAAPTNPVSLANLLCSGLTVRGLAEKFGGQRYLLRLDADDTARPAAPEHWLPLSALANHSRLLEQGQRGWRLDWRDGAAGMVFAHARQDAGSASDAETAAIQGRLRRAQADGIVERYATYAAFGGMLPLALLDLIGIVTANLGMVKVLAEHYGVPFHETRTRALLLAVVGGMLPAGLGAAAANLAARSLPGAGVLVGTTVSSAAALAVTKAIGHAYVRHFETGEPLTLPRHPLRSVA